jgi:predicted transposase YbfD/YdcC
VGVVGSQRRVFGQAPTIEQRYSLVSLQGNVEYFADSVCSHSGIEKQVHWVLDVAFAEDACRIHKDNVSENFALI